MNNALTRKRDLKINTCIFRILFIIIAKYTGILFLYWLILISYKFVCILNTLFILEVEYICYLCKIKCLMPLNLLILCIASIWYVNALRVLIFFDCYQLGNLISPYWFRIMFVRLILGPYQLYILCNKSRAHNNVDVVLYKGYNIVLSITLFAKIWRT